MELKSSPTTFFDSSNGDEPKRSAKREATAVYLMQPPKSPL